MHRGYYMKKIRKGRKVMVSIEGSPLNNRTGIYSGAYSDGHEDGEHEVEFDFTCERCTCGTGKVFSARFRASELVLAQPKKRSQ